MGSCCGADKEAVAGAAGCGPRVARLLEWLEKAQKVLESWPALALAAVSLAASFFMSGHGCVGHEARAMPLADPAWIPLLICGLPILKEALLALFMEHKIRAALLISCAMVSCVAIGQLFAAGEVAFIMALGEMLEDWTVNRAKKGLTKLVSLVPQTARYVVTCPKCLAKGEKFREVPVEDIKVGDGVRILPGETVPVDGKITEGTTTIDQSVMTGESLPVDKQIGDDVFSGTINRFGAITISATKAGEDSSLQKLVRLVKEAEKKKAPMQRIADRWAAILVPCSLTIALLTFAGVWIALGDVHTALIRGVTIMVVFCPCALALATPTSVMAAIGQATKYGVIIKSGEALERMGKVGVACFDKTGTLTTGRLGVSDVVAFGPYSKEDVLRLAAAAESSSGHPLAKAILAEAKKASSSLPNAEDFAMQSGKGVSAKVDGMAIRCGNEEWVCAQTGNGGSPEKPTGASSKLSGGVGASPTQDCKGVAERWRSEGKAVVFVSKDSDVIGLVSLADTVRTDAAAMVEELPGAGLEPVLLTGDHATTAAHVAKLLGIGEVKAGLLPAGKAEAIEAIQNEGRAVCMIGDGVNDALALETASVGIAMGEAGSDIAVEAADIALVGDDLTKIPYLKRLSNACVRLIKFNITLSVCINACAITLSILGILTPVTGALVHNLGSVLVVLNGALLYDRSYTRNRLAATDDSRRRKKT